MGNYKNIIYGATISLSITPVSAQQVAQSSCGDTQRPNVILLMVDDMNGYGVLDQYKDIITPNIARLRSQGINFTANSCASPVSTPSRTSFLSGLYPHKTGAYYNGCDAWTKNPEMSNPEKVETLPECFKRNGYTTWGRGKIFHSPMPEQRMEQNFDNRPIYQGGFGPFYEGEYLGGGRFFAIRPWENERDDDHHDNLNTQEAIRFLNQNHEKPFLMCLGLWKPHCPYTAPERFFDLYKEIDLPLPSGFKSDDLDDVPMMGRELVDSLKNFKYVQTPDSETVWRKFIEAYCANYSFADWNIGRVLDALKESAYADNTIIIFCSDNGYHCGEKLRWEKGTLWEQSAYAPMIMSMPKTSVLSDLRGTENSTPVGLIDIYPTLVDACKLSAPVQKTDGVSLIEICSNPSKFENRTTITTYGVRFSSVRDIRHRLIVYPDGKMELYDHSSDPYEWNNVASDDRYKEVVKRLSAEIPTQWAVDLGGRREVPLRKR